MSDQQILPCPFCGKSDALVERLDNSSSVVICQGMVDEHSACMARGPVGIQEDDGEEQPGYAVAVREWNERASVQPAGAAAPEGCRQRLAAEGKPYPRSSCSVCGQLSPKWRECNALLAAAADKYLIGELTFEKVFKPSGLTNLSDLQAVFDSVEAALSAQQGEQS
ncbi:Lar family restriction alleviation protein [Pseudomonas fulva]|uniref:Lar family restriction alleviation protein n=1 Tax=Pseudomonas fulva TaxID=47880 RepID=UPI00201DD286|nr:Lar family restriction alleviation protein [Pseudomonas fulva]UQY33565.1 Lar family restriction alleviation protein [Pseudomonas fulva]